MAINRQLPGPNIEVCKGDTVVVMIENKMEDAMSTSIHWHGQFQINTCHMDGVAMLTQCSIPPYEVFRHEFTAEPAGTHWYHSHSGLQMGEGLIGAFVVREPDADDPHSSLYDEDLSDHVMVINDWTDVDLMERYEEEMHDRYQPNLPINALVNGRGEKHAVKNDKKETAYTPIEVFNVDHEKRYRFRMIAATVRCWFQVSVDNHTLVVIATDGMPLKTVTVESIVIHPGERYDFVLTTNQKEGNYWIKLKGLGECQSNKGHGYATLHYTGFKGDSRPTGDPIDFSTQDGIVLNPLQTSDFREDDILQKDLRFGGDDENYEGEELGEDYNTLSINDIIAKDEAGEFPRILKNPMHEDTLTVHGQGSYSILRFKATNPGIWFFHCHNEGHFMQGMALLVKVGSPEEFPKPPSWFPKCGGYMYQHKEPQQAAPESGESRQSFPVVYVLVGAGLIILMLVLVIVILVKKMWSRQSGYTRVPS